MKKILYGLFLLTLTMTLSAQTTTWENDPHHTRIGFEVLHGGISWVSGHFKDFDITVQVPEKMTDAQINATIKTKSIDTGIDARDEHLRSKDFFEVETYPEMVFRSTRLEQSSDKQGKMHGELTLHGKTGPVVLDVELVGTSQNEKEGKNLAGFRLTGIIKRSDFGVGPDFLPAAIGDKVRIIIDGEFSAPAK